MPLNMRPQPIEERTAYPAPKNRIRSLPAIKVLVADPQYLVADAICTALAQDDGLAPLDERPTDGIEAIEVVVQRRPDVAVLDYWLQGTHGPSAVRTIREWVPGQAVIVVSAVVGPDQVRACLDAGAAGFLPKSVSVGLLAEAVHRVYDGERPVFRDRLQRMVTELSRRCLEQDVRVERLLSLTPRELAVLKELSRGRSVQETARQLSIRSGTVRAHVHSILRKTDTHNQLEAVAMARKEGLIRDD